MRYFYLWILIFTILNPFLCLAEDNDSLVKNGLKTIPTGELESFWNALQKDYGDYFDNSTNLFDYILSDKKTTLKEFGIGLSKFFFSEVLYNINLLGSIIVLTVFSVLLRSMQTAFESEQISKVAYAIVFMVIMILAIQSFGVAVDSAKTAIGRMVSFMIALVPLLLTLLTTMGNIASAALFHPAVIFMIHVVSILIYTIVFPLLFFATILKIVSAITEKYKVDNLANLLNKISIALLGGSLTIFLAVISIQGAITSVSDGVTIRTAKYITGNFVPVVGRSISDAADTVASASVLLKNTVGLAGVIILLIICVFPALKILSLSFIYKFSSAILQPLGESPLVDTLNAIGNTMIYIFAALAAVGLMFFLSVTIIIVSGNISLMVR